MKTFRGLCIFVSLTFGLSVWAAPYTVLLYVDVSNPHAVTLTATNNASLTDIDTYLLMDGVDLVSFFKSSLSGPSSTGSASGTLANPAFPAYPYDQWSADDRDAGSFNSDMNLYRGTAPGINEPQVFSTSSVAFTGMGTMDLSAVSSALPSVGASGDIVPGWGSQEPYVVIGQWEAVPEPSTILLAFGGLAALRAFRRPRRRR